MPAMRPLIRLVCCLSLMTATLLSSQIASAQSPKPAELKQLTQRQEQLEKQLVRLQRSWALKRPTDRISYAVDGQQVWADLADVVVHLKGVDWIIRHNEFSKKATAAHTKKALDEAEQLLLELQSGKSRDFGQTRKICGYVSAVDGSVQPYALTLPADFDFENPRQRHPLYVVLHGRGGLNEVGFIARNSGKEPGKDQKWIQLDVFGRIDNAFRWAGETDVFEAIADVSRRFGVDKDRITLWGFSMGGAGAWQFATHYPDRWASAGAGAGFVDFYNYQKKDRLPEYQHRPLNIYDSIPYARNLANIDFITYGGENDKQIASSQLMTAAAKEYDIQFPFVIGKDAGHKFTPEGEAEFQKFLWKHNEKGLPKYPGPREIRFVTYTPKYNRCFWLTVEELDRCYDESIVESTYDREDDRLDLQTQNIRLLTVSRDVAGQISLDDEPPLPLRDAAKSLLPEVYFAKTDAGWEVLSYDESRLYQDAGSGRKRHDLQGPIDDAFMQPFLCVRGTGKPWSKEHQAWAEWRLQRFANEFDKWMRGRVRIVNDTDVTPEMLEQYHVVLFGDPGSNSLIADIKDELPLEWTPESCQLGDQKIDTSKQGAALIYPNPANPHKYVVLNSGMTTLEKDFKASNSWLFAKHGDVAILDFEAKDNGFEETTRWAGLFTDDWLLPEDE